VSAPEVAITIRQPWASCIAVDHAGAKRVENRGRPTSHRGPVAIHAGKAGIRGVETDWRIRHLFGDHMDIDHRARGAVIAVANLVDCHQARLTDPDGPVCCYPWGDWRYQQASGEVPAWHLVLADVVRLPKPVPARGALNVPWRMPADVVDRIAAQLDDMAAASTAVTA
jgi:hypothetical protein